MAHMWNIIFQLHRMHSTSLNTDMTIEQSGLCETYKFGGIALALLASFTTLATQSPPSASQEVRVYLPPHHTGSCSSFLLFLKVGQGRGMHHKKLCQETSWWQQLPFRKNQACPFLKTNTTKSIFAIDRVLLLKASYWYKPTLEYLTYLDPQCNVPPLGNNASNSSATKKSPSPCWLHNSRVIDLLQVTPMCCKHQQKLEKLDPLVFLSPLDSVWYLL